MKTILLGTTTVFALALLGAPTMAQYRDDVDQRQPGEGQPRSGTYSDNDLSARIAQLRDRIRDDVQNGRIRRDRAEPLRQRALELSDRERQYSLNGLSARERDNLQHGMRDLHQQIRLAENGGRSGADEYDRSDQSYDRSRDDDDRGTKKSNLGNVIDRVMGTSGPKL